jgi:endonuclease/exonuclease/phosphatase (EEP) superfamily protein YafD
MAKKVLAAIAMLIGGIAVLATVGAFFGGFWWGFDLLANYRWQAMWAAMIASVLYALFGRGLFTAIFIVAAAINMWLILPAWIGDQPDGTGEGTVRITHVDLSGGLTDVDETAAWLVATDADVLLVADPPAAIDAAISAADPTYELLNPGAAIIGVAVFTRGDRVMATRTDPSGAPVYRITIPSESGVMDVITARGPMATSSSTSDELANRFATIADAVNASDNPAVVVGNLGATKWSAVSRDLLATTALRDATEGSGYLSTWPTSDLPIIGGWIGIPIDVVYMDPELTPLDVVVGPNIGAEHLPMTVDVSPVAEGES